jgi:hypothetical protein
MSDPLEALKAKKAAILADAERAASAVDDDLRALAQAQAIANRYGLVLAKAPEPEPESPPPPPPLPVIQEPSQVETLSNIKLLCSQNRAAYKAAICVAEYTVKQFGRPLELNDLYGACIAMGVRLGGKRPQSTLSAYLSHDSSTVESIRKGVYWLKGVPVPDPKDTPTDGGAYINGRRIPDDMGSPLMKLAASLAWRDEEPASGT